MTWAPTAFLIITIDAAASNFLMLSELSPWGLPIAGALEHGTPRSNTHAQHAFSISIFSCAVRRVIRLSERNESTKAYRRRRFEKKIKTALFCRLSRVVQGKSTHFPNIKAPGLKQLLVNDSNDGRAVRNIHLVGAPHTPCVEIPYLEKNHEMIFEANSE